MDWYFGSDMEDFVVPEHEELSDRLPSSDGWLDWGLNSPKNKYSDANFTRDGLNLDGQYFGDEVDMETSFHDRDQSSGSSLCRGMSDKSLELAALSNDWPDYQLNDLPGTEKMDDIFLNSILEDPVVGKIIHKPFYSSHESQGGVNQADIFSIDMVLDTECLSSDKHGTKNSKYLDEYAYSSPSVWDEGVETDIQFFLCNSGKNDRLPAKALLVKGLAPPVKNTKNGQIDEKTSLEESVLQELKMAMIQQFTEKTRVCFRDSLYRLANNSTQQNILTQSLNGDIFTEKAPPWTARDGARRSGRKKATMESKTNKIDRAVANLMYNKMESNVKDIPGTAIAKFKQEEINAKGAQNYNSKQPFNYHPNHCHATFTGDAEVPVHSQRFPNESFSINSVGKRL